MNSGLYVALTLGAGVSNSAKVSLLLKATSLFWMGKNKLKSNPSKRSLSAPKLSLDGKLLSLKGQVHDLGSSWICSFCSNSKPMPWPGTLAQLWLVCQLQRYQERKKLAVSHVLITPCLNCNMGVFFRTT